MAQSELLIRMVRTLEAAGVEYMWTGSFVSGMQGEACSTHDIDFVVNFNRTGAKLLLLQFPPPDYYLDELAIEPAIASKTQFNLLELSSEDKVDF